AHAINTEHSSTFDITLIARPPSHVTSHPCSVGRPTRLAQRSRRLSSSVKSGEAAVPPSGDAHRSLHSAVERADVGDVAGRVELHDEGRLDAGWDLVRVLRAVVRVDERVVDLLGVVDRDGREL